MGVGIHRYSRGLQAIIVAVEDADLVNYLDFNDMNALTSSSPILHGNRKTTRIRWMRSYIKIEDSDTCKLKTGRITNTHTDNRNSKLSSEGLDVIIRMVKSAFDNGMYWPIEVLLSVMPNLEPHLLHACTVYCMDNINANENQSKVWSPTQLKICQIFFSFASKTYFSQYGLSTLVVTSKAEFQKHLANDNYDVVKLLWPYAYSRKDLEAGIICQNLVNFIAQASNTTSKIDFVLKLGIKTCRISGDDSAPFLETMLSTVFKLKRHSETVQTVERLIAWGANPMEAVMPIITEKQCPYVHQAQKEANILKPVMDVLILAGINLTNLYSSPLGRSLCKQCECRFTFLVDYLIELDQVDVFEAVKAVLWRSNQLKRQKEELLERAIEVSVKSGYIHLLNIVAKRPDLMVISGRHVVLAVKHSQSESLKWLLEAGARPNHDETVDIITNMLSINADHNAGMLPHPRVCHIFLTCKFITHVELFDIIVQSCSDKSINWNAIYRILHSMSQQKFFNAVLSERGEHAFLMLTTSIDHLQYRVANLCLELNFGKDRKPPVIEQNEQFDKTTANLDKLLLIASGKKPLSRLLILWILDTPGFQPSRDTARKLLFSSLNSTPPIVDVFEQLFNFDYVLQSEIFHELSQFIHYNLEPGDVTAVLRVLSKRGLQPPPTCFLGKFYRAQVLMHMANLEYSDLILWFLNTGVRPTFQLTKLIQTCLCRNLLEVIQKLVELKFTTLDSIVDPFCNQLSGMLATYGGDSDIRHHHVVLWMLKSGYLDDDTPGNRQHANRLLTQALKYKKVLIINTLMANGVGFGDEHQLEVGC
ncbi:hypothetical protein HDU76_002204 [Blyttiomyces sp. JEL0837]|nr:hypothetical protein HDU76_002204 [Blyttiomyces sp. JEL0837]